MTAIEDVRRSYRTAFLRYLGRGEEASLHSGYELGRSAVVTGLSLLELVQVHHDVLIEALQQRGSDDSTTVATAASEFLLEVLATYDMTHRGFLADR
jgi:hypothetical protein